MVMMTDLPSSASGRSQHQQARQSSRRPPRACIARTPSRLAPAAPSVKHTPSIPPLPLARRTVGSCTACESSHPSSTSSTKVSRGRQACAFGPQRWQPWSLCNVFEPVLVLGRNRFASVDMRIRVRGGGHTSQIYAIYQAIAKAMVAFYQKFVDEQSKKEIHDILVMYDRTLLVADPRRCEPKNFGGARARFQKSYG
ncbi:hypothetical protein GOP47_0016497 [Adiantum capillus-veneris]|uniref:40S ribosomal protein S16 n=1 Tax=Adiantum capillus-veneris TaxID=13818 RepID=A0A9D4ZBS9_ADICA|nr:hypothetical protein GOP47_0016497 [Adiantum capillus-veneris]